MINYIVQVMLFQALFLFVYDAFLKKETFFTKNRWYLLLTPLASFVIPLIRIPSLQKSIPTEISILLPEIVLSPQKAIEQTPIQDSIAYGPVIFWIGLALFFILFLAKISKLILLIRQNKVITNKTYKLVVLPNSKKAFSFFNYIFLGENVTGKDKEKIILHELVHSSEKHSLDLLFFEILKIVMWFNPLIYVYQKRISIVHEYISDDKVVKSSSKKDYLNKLINELFDVEDISFVNQFFVSSFIKKRIKMLSKKRSKQVMQLKYLLLIPVLISMLFYMSCSNELDSSLNSNNVGAKQSITYYNANGKTNTKQKLLEVYRKRTNDNEQGFPDTFMDRYTDRVKPTYGTKISEKELTDEELTEYKEFLSNHNYNGFAFWSKVELYKLENQRKMIAVIWDFSMDDAQFDPGNVEPAEEVSFAKLNKVPTFPGCEDNDKKCFVKKIQQHFAKNFDTDLPNKLKLSSGPKRLIINFKIDTSGNVVDINVKAPVRKLEEEVIRLVKMLPKMTPGEKEGKKVKVKFTLPMRIDVK
ncbi:M56 family metallopeptidase [Pseudotenacibaculum sp. MALMAid0570]|uniref:M56 family metallopeptidase n=1 Tax=Pseudotenacibaculum sp. MALMAid0570 TaxID=3143938 RepID=UPI0032DFF8B1